RPLSPAVNASGVAVLAGCKHITQPPVLIGVDLAASKALVQDAQCIVAAVLLTTSARIGPPGGTGDQDVHGPDQQAPERDHADPHQGDLPEGPAAAVPEHHHNHLLPGAGCPGPS